MSHLVVFVSGEGTNLQVLIDSIQSGIIQNAEISLVISNNKNAPALKRARKANIKTQVELFDRNNETRQDYDKRLYDIVSQYSPDLVVLAGWMHVFTNVFLNCSAKVINLHPALPGQFPGKDGIGDAFNAFKEGKITETGIMVHEVVEEVDAGKVIDTCNVPINENDTLETLRERVRYFEKPLLVRSVINVLESSTDNSQSNDVYQGKVRDVIDIGYDVLEIAHSDRLSSFDRHICDVKWKGHCLNLTSVWWFEKTKHIVPNHLLYASQNSMIVKKCKPYLVEVVIRGYITGSTKTSLWTHYNNGERTYCGINFPDGLVKHQRLEHPVITPTTKGVVDRPISSDEVVSLGLMNESEWEYVSSKAMELFLYGQEVAAERGYILVDTKYEFGKDSDGNILLIDEIHTCDSSRFWLSKTYDSLFKLGKEPERIDKDIVREYVKTKCDPYTVKQIPVIPQHLKDHVSRAYVSFYERLTGNTIDSLEYNKTQTISENYFNNLHRNIVVILAGSVKDDTFVNKIRNELNKVNIYSRAYVASAHKNTQMVLEILNGYEEQKSNRNIVYVTVAGRSNALSGVVACNSTYPVIACPPFKDKSDMMVNINSTLQMPSRVPVMTILEPNNVALAIQRLFTLN